MKTLTHICEEADKDLSFLKTEKGLLEKTVRQWIDDSFKILAYKISIKNFNMIIVVSELNEAKQEKISIMRFFPMSSGTWAASVDLQFKEPEEAFQYLLNHFE